MSAKTPSKPEELKAFEEKFQKNTKYSGFGLETTLHMPCGFCAEPDFLVYKIIEVDQALKRGGVCKACKRGLKAIFHVDQPGNKQFEMVQYCGPDAPRFLTPIRRIDCAACNDTHKVMINEREVMCTHCPRPCADCHHGAFCKSTPCGCKCHKEKRASPS